MNYTEGLSVEGAYTAFETIVRKQTCSVLLQHDWYCTRPTFKWRHRQQADTTDTRAMVPVPVSTFPTSDPVISLDMPLKHTALNVLRFCYGSSATLEDAPLWFSLRWRYILQNE